MSEKLDEEIGYNLQISKQTSTLGGEVSTITTNVRKGASEDELWEAASKMYAVLDRRTGECNDKFKTRQKELGKKKTVDLEDVEAQALLNGESAGEA
jgi:hypothetical protein